MSTATVKPTTVRIEEGLKEQATEFLDTVGLSLNSYLNLAVRQLVNQRKIPFEIVGRPEVPNEATRRAMVIAEDYKRTMRIHPQLKTEFKAAVAELAARGSLPAEYGAHELSNPGGNYNGHIDFHLSDGLVDVVVLYLPHKTNPVIRLVRMGSHEELFQGPQG